MKEPPELSLPATHWTMPAAVPAPPPAPGLRTSGVLTATLILVALAAGPYGAVTPLWEAIFIAGALTTGAVWLWRAPAATWVMVRHNPLLKPWLALVIYAFCQLLPVRRAPLVAGENLGGWRALSFAPTETAVFGWKMLALLLLFLIWENHTRQPRRLKALLWLVVGLGTASALFGLARFLLQPWLAANSGFVLAGLKPGVGFGQLINPNHFALLMEMTGGVTLGLALGSWRQARFPLYLALTFLQWTALVLTYSRGGVLSLLVQVTAAGLLYPTMRGTRPRSVRVSLFIRLAGVLLLTVLIAGGVLWVGGDMLTQRLARLPDQWAAPPDANHLNARRRDIWRATWQLARAYPLCGVGFGAYATAIPQTYDASGRFTPQQAHDEYLELLAGGGLCGLALGGWWLVALFRATRQRWRHSTNLSRHFVRLGALTGLCGVLCHSLVDFGLHVTFNAAICVALLVLAVAPDKITQD